MFGTYTLIKLWGYKFVYVTTHTNTARSADTQAGPVVALTPPPRLHIAGQPCPTSHRRTFDARPACLTVVARTRLALGAIAREPPSRPRSPGPSESLLDALNPLNPLKPAKPLLGGAILWY